MLTLGAYRLVDVVGHGGMAEVWSARFDGHQVAVKVVTAAAFRQPDLASGLQREVRAVASLDHPAIVRVHDQGRVSAAEAGASKGHFAEGSPYLVMELAGEGTLRAVRNWGALRRVLGVLLDALAHAHARGILHLDLKPSNVLQTGGEHPYRLADFGLAHLVEGQGPISALSMGTPTYMAPEQVRRAWRDWGPWTDLYALGCLGWCLASGRPPFEGSSVKETLEAQVRSSLPSFVPRGPLPSGFEGWLRRLLRKAGEERFSCAAEARFALEQLDADALGDTLAELEGSEGVAARAGARTMVPVQPPLPDWRSVAHRPLRVPSLRLFGVRQPGLVGRQDERDALWAELREVCLGKVRCTLLAGPVGIGKSRLAVWLARRAHEVGAAFTLEARLASQPGPHHGLGPMVERFFRCVGLERQEVRERVASWWGAHERWDGQVVDGLTELIRPAGDREQDPSRHLGGRAHRVDTVVRLLAAAARHRPVVLLLEELQTDDEAVALASALLDAAAGGRARSVLVVATAIDPGSEATRKLVGRSDVRFAPLEPLGRADVVELVADLLVLESGAAQAIAERSGGNPLFAVQLVGGLVDRRALLRTREGFRPASHAAVALPDSLHTLWQERAELAMAARTEADQIAVELAAVLGTTVDRREWDAAVRDSGLQLSLGLLDELADAGLVRLQAESLTFGHALLRESVRRASIESGRWPDRCRHVAAMLMRVGGPRAAERAAAQLLDGEALEEALPCLRQAALQAHLQGESALLAELSKRRLKVLRRLGVDRSDPRAGESELHLASAERNLGELDSAVRRLSRVKAQAVRHGWEALLGPILVALAGVNERLGHQDEALAMALGAADHARQRGDRADLGEALNIQAWVAMRAGDRERALDLFSRAIQLLAAHGTCSRQLAVCSGKIQLLIVSGRLDEAQALAEDNLALAMRAGVAARRGNLLYNLGVIAWERRDLETALRHLLAATELLRRLGNVNAEYIEVNAASVLVELGRYDEARVMLLAKLDAAATHRQPLVLGAVLLALLCCSAALGHREGWHRHLDALERSMHPSLSADANYPRFADLAADLAEQRGWTTAARARGLARRLRTGGATTS
jgi:eukaryotic-like serine/threonine-protein kinase